MPRQDGFEEIRSELRALRGQFSGLESALGELQKALERGLREGLKEGLAPVSAGIARLTEVQGQVELLKESAEVSVLPAVIDHLSGENEKRVGQATTEMTNIKDNYTGVLAKLADAFQRELRTLGEHAFNVLEEDFTGNIASRTMCSTTAPFEQSNLRIAQEREAKLGNRLPTAFARLEDYRDRKRAFRQRVEDLRLKGLRAGSYDVAVALWVAEVQDQNGTRSVVAVPASEIDATADDDGFPLQLQPRPEFAALGDFAQRSFESFAGSHKWRALTTEEIDALRTALNTLVERGHVSSTASEELFESIRSHIPDRPA